MDLCWSNLCPKMFCFEDLVVVLVSHLFSVGRLKVGLVRQQGVRVPLLWSWGEECVSKEILSVFGVGAAISEVIGGRTTLGERWGMAFDATMGYPGEDIKDPCAI